MEFEGKNLKTAIKKACDFLKTEKNKLNYDVISFGSTGIFGLVGIRKARIRVQIDESLASPKPFETETALQAETGEGVAVELDEATLEDVSLSSLNLEDQETQTVDKLEAETGDQCQRFKDIEDLEKTKQKEEIGQNGFELVQKIVGAITDDAKVECQTYKSHIKYNVTGGNSAILIGKKGQTLEAIQYLVEKAINKMSLDRIRVIVDIEGYMANRKKQLRKMALHTAQKVKASGKPSSVGQMNSHDRRIVHMALKNDAKVRTQSMGDGYLRKLVIFPKKAGLQRKNNKSIQNR
jgi:spoIIIJ-associated protein